MITPDYASVFVQLLSAMATVGTLIVIYFQLQHTQKTAENTLSVRKAELITVLNGHLEKHINVRIAIKLDKDMHELHENTEYKSKYTNIEFEMRDYVIIFESLWPFIESKILSPDEFNLYFGKRFSELENSKLMKELLSHDEFIDMKENLDKLREIRRSEKAASRQQTPWWARRT